MKNVKSISAIAGAPVVVPGVPVVVPGATVVVTPEPAAGRFVLRINFITIPSSGSGNFTPPLIETTFTLTRLAPRLICGAFSTFVPAAVTGTGTSCKPSPIRTVPLESTLKYDNVSSLFWTLTISSVPIPAFAVTLKAVPPVSATAIVSVDRPDMSRPRTTMSSTLTSPCVDETCSPFAGAPGVPRCVMDCVSVEKRSTDFRNIDTPSTSKLPPIKAVEDPPCAAK